MNIYKLFEDLWRVGLFPTRWFRCPKCGSKIMQVGFPKLTGFVTEYEFKCTNEKCDWR